MTITLHPITQLKGHTAPVLCAKYAKDTILGDHVLASGSEDNTCRIWDLRSQRVVKGIKGLHNPVSSVEFAPVPESSLLYLSSGTKVFTYDIRNTSMILSEATREYDFSSDEINSIDVNGKHTYLATADDNGEVKIIDLATHTIFKKMTKKHGNLCMSVKFSQRMTWEVWSGGLDCKIYRWDYSRGKPLDIINTTSSEPSASQMFNPPFVYTLGSSLDGNWIAAGLGDASIQLFNFGDKKKKKQQLDTNPREIRLENGHTNMVNCLSFLPLLDGNNTFAHLLSGSVNGSLALWRLPHHLDDVTDHHHQLQETLEKYQLDDSIARLNHLESYSLDGTSTQLAVAGVGTQCNLGVLNLYSLL
ncbi:WD40-repeat-containing domain protein [Halteromyces radiatus]|uniref:WD40-repeat-containing domain protein n=1 Tax=Halteromyces radiatus TaxID=101107 RepID=UPI0022204BEB|nr:WD40-repeat-containing domain protein [Halteromyces radiatus]KAI8089354.1 WD40-repeat-containing domain protein [Halteromyces radiatus]